MGEHKEEELKVFEFLRLALVCGGGGKGKVMGILFLLLLGVLGYLHMDRCYKKWIGAGGGQKDVAGRALADSWIWSSSCSCG